MQPLPPCTVTHTAVTPLCTDTRTHAHTPTPGHAPPVRTGQADTHAYPLCSVTHTLLTPRTHTAPCTLPRLTLAHAHMHTSSRAREH